MSRDGRIGGDNSIVVSNQRASRGGLRRIGMSGAYW